MTGNRADENLMMCHEVAYLFRGSTTETVATWARRGRVAEVRTADGKPGHVGGRPPWGPAAASETRLASWLWSVMWWMTAVSARSAG
jgi:hypothetical protein